ncbi:rhodanese-like domain-containing protein [Persicobacter diffluens]|uniref:Rhodanese domain-containing protein n=1 Tax=Persicobacter diffluens TaxID=981 RepID=A0AAN5APH3_9BACT|nr:hypothetical protein PEDI_43900 [Persicobacter diffluens]
MFGFLKGLFGSKGPGVKELKEQGALFLDVRTAAEYRKGHVKGAMNIPLDLLASQADKLKARNKAIVVYCQSGKRAKTAKGILENAGVETVVNGGGWQRLSVKLADFNG